MYTALSELASALMAIRLASPGLTVTFSAQPGLPGEIPVMRLPPLKNTSMVQLLTSTSSCADEIELPSGTAGTSNSWRNKTHCPSAEPSEYQIGWVPLKKSPPDVNACAAGGHQPES